MVTLQSSVRSGSSLYPMEHDVADFKPFKLPGCGLQCDACGENLPSVAHTRKTSGLIIRERRCPKCGELNKTVERVISRGKGTFSSPCE